MSEESESQQAAEETAKTEETQAADETSKQQEQQAIQQTAELAAKQDESGKEKEEERLASSGQTGKFGADMTEEELLQALIQQYYAHKSMNAAIIGGGIGMGPAMEKAPFNREEAHQAAEGKEGKPAHEGKEGGASASEADKEKMHELSGRPSHEHGADGTKEGGHNQSEDMAKDKEPSKTEKITTLVKEGLDSACDCSQGSMSDAELAQTASRNFDVRRKLGNISMDEFKKDMLDGKVEPGKEQEHFNQLHEKNRDVFNKLTRFTLGLPEDDGKDSKPTNDGQDAKPVQTNDDKDGKPAQSDSKKDNRDFVDALRHGDNPHSNSKPKPEGKGENSAAPKERVGQDQSGKGEGDGNANAQTADKGSKASGVMQMGMRKMAAGKGE